MLKCDFGNLHREVSLLEGSGAKVLHLDVMDGHFVPNLTYGPVVIERMRALTDLPLDAHLMISRPDQFLADYLKAGCDAITVHIEAVPQPAALLERIREQDAVAGLALNPGTPVAAILPFLTHCDLVLVMSVEPGFGGQKFIPAALDKLREVRKRAGAGLLVSIDGGVGASNIGDCAEAGADIFVTGSAVFDSDDYEGALAGLCQSAAARMTSRTAGS